MTAIDAQPELVAGPPAAGGQVACAHCGLPVPPGLLQPGAAQQFCCAACGVVYEAIRSCGLEGYYGLRERLDAPRVPARTTGRRYEAFDDPGFATLYCTVTGPGTVAAELYLENVHCAACVWLVERLPRVLPGLIETRLDFRRHVVRLVWLDGQLTLSRIARALDRLGYPAHPCRGREDLTQRRLEDRRALIRIGVAGAAAGNAMLIAFALYGGMLHGMEPGYQALFRWASLAVAAVSLAWPGRVFFQRALAAIRTRTMHMDVPIAVGLAAGAAWSVASTIRGSGAVYFESITVLVFLLLVGRWVQSRRQRAGQDAVELLFSMTPGTARLVEGDAVREVPTDSLPGGAIIEVLAGAPVPADGSVVAGRSSVNRSLLTGESRPVAIAPGDAVHAGTVNTAGPVRIVVEATGQATRLGRLMKLVEESAARRAPIVAIADRVAGWFVMAVLGLAAVTFGAWLLIDPGRAVPNAIALLIVTCPCALALATPLAVVAGIGRAARHGMLIKGGDVVERLGGGGLVFLDKTGTLTRGRPAVVAWHGTAETQSAVAAVEMHSMHPVAKAITEAYGDAAERRDCRQVEAAANGVRGIVDGRAIAAGSRVYLASQRIAIPPWAAAIEGALVADTVTPVFVADEGVVAAVAGVGDPVREDAAAAIADLRALGWRAGVLSGDHPDVVRAVAAQLGIDAADCRGGLGPEDKQAIVETAAAVQPVIMVGDGVNDAAALAAATVGVAVRGGAECSLAAADVYLATPGLSALPSLIRGARRTTAVIRRNLVISLIYNAAGVSLAMAGLVNPLLAAVLMPVSSLTVLTLSHRSRTFEAAPCPSST